MRYLSAHYVFPVSSPPLKNGIICVADDGRIVDMIDTGGKLEEREKLEFYNGILVPGFVNAHCHLELSHLRGTIEPHGGLPGFISSVGKVRRADSETIRAAAKAADDEMTRNGIVAVGDVSNTTDSLQTKRDSRLQYQTFIEIFGLNGCRSKEIFAAAKRTESKFHRAGLRATVSPHAVYSVSRALWKTLFRSIAIMCPQVISMHHQESDEELGVFLDGKGVLADMFRKNGFLISDEHLPLRDEINNIDRHFKQAARCLLVHNTFSSKNDLAKYLSTPNKYYFVLCPGSNLFIQNHLPDLQLFASQEFHRNTCLGTDSLASNTGLSILEEMKIIQQHASAIPFETILQWATINGASALGMDDWYGSFKKEKIPGINLITGFDFDKMKLSGTSNVEVLVNNGK